MMGLSVLLTTVLLYNKHTNTYGYVTINEDSVKWTLQISPKVIISLTLDLPLRPDFITSIDIDNNGKVTSSLDACDIYERNATLTAALTDNLLEHIRHVPIFPRRLCIAHSAITSH